MIIGKTEATCRTLASSRRAVPAFRSTRQTHSMSQLFIVVEKLSDWSPYYPSEDVITFDTYLNLSEASAMAASGDDRRAAMAGRTRVVNLCRSYKYLSRGYYCSLLAEARGHHVIPSVKTLNALERKAVFTLSFDFEELDLDQALLTLKADTTQEASKRKLVVRSYFGVTNLPEFKTLGEIIFEQFPCPLVDIELKYKNGWMLSAVKPMRLTHLDDEDETAFASSFDAFTKKLWRKPKARKQFRYDMAVLINPDEKMPPSDAQAMKRLHKVAKQKGIAIDFIGPRDLNRVPEYDMLFIRETTAINHHTFRFAKKAEAEGVIVMDDSASIMRCTNKVFLADLLHHHKVPTPKTLILSKGHHAQLKSAAETLGFPMVLKIPDGSFSRGVMKAENHEQLEEKSEVLFKQSALLLAQEFMYTDYDWRIGVLNGKPIYACKYFMARDHWQIYKHEGSSTATGAWDTMAIHEVPKAVVQAAVKAANLIGRGLYGVDVKQSGSRVAIIEVNDNPSLESGVEDKFLGHELYGIILDEFIRRAELKHAS